MRPTHVLVPLALLLALPLLPQEPAPGGDPAPEEEAPRSGFDAFFADERARIEKEIEGTWVLQEFQPADFLFDAENIRGVAMFRDGYLSLNIMAQTFVPEFLGDGGQLWVQGGAHRYRISEFLELQTAVVFAFQNLSDDEELVVEASGTPREYRVDIDAEGATLTMTNTDGARLVWSRMAPTEFPVGSLDALEQLRGR
jgi:hypothetical protein